MSGLNFSLRGSVTISLSSLVQATKHSPIVICRNSLELLDSKSARILLRTLIAASRPRML